MDVTAIRIHEFGGPEVLRLEQVEVGPIASGQALIRVSHAGVNFMDINQRKGIVGEPEFPKAMGMEGAGTVEAVASDVSTVRVGDRVAWQMLPGSYATHAVLPADRLIPVPDAVDTPAAAASVLQGLTAHYLTTAAHPVAQGDTCLVQAAAGGVGLLICQMVRRLGGRVIGVVSTPAKADAVREAGADEVIVHGDMDLVSAVKHRMSGGVTVVYDGVGKETFEASFECLAPRGHMVLFGQASGAVPPFDLARLTPKSISVSRPGLPTYTSDRTSLLERATDLFRWIVDGEITIHIDHVYSLKDAAMAQESLASRRTIGKVLLDVS